MNKEMQNFQKNLHTFPMAKQRILKSAYCIAKKEHSKQKKFGIYPYLIHPISVFNFLVQKVEIRDLNILTSAILHDTVEDGRLSFPAIHKKFGKGVTDIVKAVTRIPKSNETEKQKLVSKTRHFNKFIANGSYGVRIVGIADKYDNIKNMQVIGSKNPNHQKRTRWIREAKGFIPIAKRINNNAYLLLKKEVEKAEKYLKYES